MFLTKRESYETGRDYALRTIKENIINLDLVPGSKVSENELAEEMGLSRAPVREALIELSKVGIVCIYPQRGSVISLIDYNLVEQACFMRETLETAVVERCCLNGIDGIYLEGMKENLELQKFYLDNENNHRRMELDNEFHMLFFKAEKLMLVHELMAGMLVHFDRVRQMALVVEKKPQIIQDHINILEAVEKRDREEAVAFLHNHLNRYKIDKEIIEAKYPQYMKD